MRPQPTVLPLALIALTLAGCAEHRSGLTPLLNILSVQFETQREIDNGVSSATDAELADFNGDGIADLAILGLAGDLTVFLGTGGGALAPSGSFAVTIDGSEVRSGDLDLDGDQDLVIASFAQNVIDVLLNDGTANFTRLPSVVQTGQIPAAMAVVDCDEDAIPDIILTHLELEFVDVFTGNGDGTFQPAQQLSVPTANRGRSAGIALADITGDGFLEILVADSDNDRLVAFLGDSPQPHNPTTITVTVGAGPFGVAAGDLAGNSVAEIAVSNFSEQSIVVLNSQFDILQRIDVGGRPGFITIADVTGDGINDLIASLIGSRAIVVFAGTGDTSAPLGPPTHIPTTGFPLRPLAGDVNGDGRDDLVIAGVGTNKVNVFLARDGGLSGGRLYETSLQDPAEIATADFDGDGFPDVAAGGRGEERVAILRSRGAGSPPGSVALDLAHLFSVAESTAGMRMIHGVAASDVDADGRPDIVVLVDGGIKVGLNRTPTASGAFEFDVLPMGGVFAAGAQPRVVLVEDVTRDGFVDAIVGYTGQEEVAVAPGLGDGTFGPTTPIALPGRLTGITTGDFDGDGALEVAVSVRQPNRIITYEVEATGALVPSVNVELDQSPTKIASTDLNRDGRADLIASIGEASNVALFIALETGGFGPATDVETGEGPTALVTGDLNRDLRADVVVTSLRGSDFHVVLGDGAGGATTSTRFPGLFSASTASLADLDGDGLEDLVVGSFGYGRVGVFKNVSVLAR